MDILISLTIGIVYAAATWMLLSRTLLRVLLGVALIGHGANLMIVATAGASPASKAPIITGEASVLASDAGDPLPQALVLTAIVIGMGLLGFALALAWRAVRALGDDDLDRLTTCDPLPQSPAKPAPAEPPAAPTTSAPVAEAT